MRLAVKEWKWLCVALVGMALMFESWTVLEVKDDKLVVSRISFWFREKEVKRLPVSDVGEVRLRAGPKHCRAIIVSTKGGEEFVDFMYGSSLTADRYSSRDFRLLNSAIKSGHGFRQSRCESFLWVALVIVSLFTYFYKRSWRLEYERQDERLKQSKAWSQYLLSRKKDRGTSQQDIHSDKSSPRTVWIRELKQGEETRKSKFGSHLLPRGTMAGRGSGF